MPFQVLGGKSPIELNDNGFLDQASGDPSPHSSQYTFGVNLVDQSARQAMASGGTPYGGMGQSWDEYVTQNSTGVAFALNSVEDGLIVKPHLHDFEYNVKMIKYVSKQYEKQINDAWDMAEDMAPTIAIELAKKGAMLLPPHLKVGALGLLALLDICLAVKDVYDAWDEEVVEYAQKHNCSREVAEKNVRPLKNILDAAMIFSTQEWVKYALKTEGIHAESKIAIIFAVLQSISEEKLREWGRSLRDQRE